MNMRERKAFVKWMLLVIPVLLVFYCLTSQAHAEANSLEILKGRAEQGDVLAQRELAVVYAQGQGVPKDDNQALYWCKKAAEQGDAKSQVMMGGRYVGGLGVPQNDKEAYSWFKKAAEQGEPTGQIMLATMYTLGRGVAQSDEEAYVWYILANAKGDATKLTTPPGSKKLSPEQLDRAIARAIEIQAKIDALKNERVTPGK